jgi:catechol 2,3-dioxygenase-like lactoylglutathione lyase family enzyme
MKKTITFLSAIICSSLLHAQDAAIVTFTFNHNALSVKDVNRSAEFYKNVLQLTEITNRTQMEGIRWFSLGEGRELHLVSVIKEPVTINKAVHFALNTNNIDALVKRLSELNVAYSDWPGNLNKVTLRADGVKQIYFQDPDGYWIEINDVSTNVSADQIKNEVWQLEENYWKYVKEKDYQSYLTLWDENFLGYPSNNTVGNKDHITDWMTEMYQQPGVFNYSLTRKVENVFGDIVIVFYDVSHNFTNDKNEVVKKGSFKIIHTWKKTEKGWLIIGGMGANK